MKGNPLRHVRYLLALVCMASMAGPVSAHDDTAAASSATFTTLTVLPLAIEGLAGDNHSSLYTTGRAATPNRCPVWQINMAGTPPVQPVQVGSIPNATGDACNPSGIAFDRSGNIYVADAAQGGVIWRVTGADPNPATPFATGVPGTNGIAFDRQGNLWTGDGTSGQGRVWKISPTGGNCAGGIQVGCIEAFRVPPLANLKGIGRQISTLQPPGAANPQSLVANGVAFDWWGDLYVADTARGAIWRVRFDRNGNVRSPMGCDSTFMRDTLCLSNVFVAHPIIEGVDGIALDRAGNIWAAANERNAIGIVTPDRRVYEFFRNPGNGQGLRNSADTADGNKHILELPTSPYLNGTRLCVAQSDGDRRDNSPRASGEVNGGSGSARGKISCLDQTLYTSGLPLPLQ